MAPRLARLVALVLVLLRSATLPETKGVRPVGFAAFAGFAAWSAGVSRGRNPEWTVDLLVALLVLAGLAR